MSYAQRTSVSVSKTQAEIRGLLTRYGAEAFGLAERGGFVQLAFEYEGRLYRIEVVEPQPEDDECRRTRTGLSRTEAQALTTCEQLRRALWRSLRLLLHAKLEAVEAGITSVEREFLSDLVLPSGDTVSRWVEPQIVAGKMPKLLMPGGS